MDDVLSQYDADADAAISLPEFTAYVRKKDKQMREVFKSLDVDATGELGVAEVVRAMRRLGIGATEADGAKMVRLLDSDRDGTVTFSEFKQYTSLLPAAQLRANAAYVWMGTSVDRLVTNPRDPAKNLVVGAAAGAVSRFLTAPLERLRVILMAQKDATALAAVRAVVRDEGAAGLWRGSAAKILKVMPASAIQFTAFAAFKNLFLSRSRTGELTVPETLASGALAGLVRWVLDRRRLLRLAGPPQVAAVAEPPPGGRSGGLTPCAAAGRTAKKLPLRLPSRGDRGADVGPGRGAGGPRCSNGGHLQAVRNQGPVQGPVRGDWRRHAGIHAGVRPVRLGERPVLPRAGPQAAELGEGTRGRVHRLLQHFRDHAPDARHYPHAGEYIEPPTGGAED